MWSSGSSDGGRHSVVRLTRRTALGSVANGFTAPMARPKNARYSIADAPGHCADGSLEVMNGLPRIPAFVTFMITLPTFSTEPGPKTSGWANGVAPRRVVRLAWMRAWTSCSYSRNPWYSGSPGCTRAAAGDANVPITMAMHRPHAACFD